MTLPYPPPYMDLTTLSVHICAGESTIEAWIKQGLFPPARKVGGKRLWRWKDVDQHLALNPELTASSRDQQAEAITNATRAAASRNH